MLFKPIVALHIMNFSSCRNYWGGGGGQNDMFAPPPPIFALGGGGNCPHCPPSRIDAFDEWSLRSKGQTCAFELFISIGISIKSIQVTLVGLSIICCNCKYVHMSLILLLSGLEVSMLQLKSPKTITLRDILRTMHFQHFLPHNGRS